VEPEVESEVEGAWDAEIRERIARYDAGQTAGVPGREVFAELDKKLDEKSNREGFAKPVSPDCRVD